MRVRGTLQIVTICFGLLPGILSAEAPAITALSPAGGQRGETVEVTVQGKLGTPPLSFWSNRPELTAHVSRETRQDLFAHHPGIGNSRHGTLANH